MSNPLRGLCFAMDNSRSFARQDGACAGNTSPNTDNGAWLSSPILASLLRVNAFRTAIACSPLPSKRDTISNEKLDSQSSDNSVTRRLENASPTSDLARGTPTNDLPATHVSQSDTESLYSNPSPRSLIAASFHSSSFTECLRGAAASITNIALTFPLNKLISRQAYEGLSVREAAHTMVMEGRSNLYRGVAPPLVQKAVSMGIMYGTFDFYYHALSYIGTGKMELRAATDVPSSGDSWGYKAVAAILSGSTEGILTPFERMQTILQHRHYTEQFSNTWDVAKKLKPYGFSEYYRGVSAILLRNGPANAIFFILRDPVTNMLPAWPSTPDSPHSNGRTGGGSSATSTKAVTSPKDGSPAAIVPMPGFISAGAMGSEFMWNLVRNFVSGAILGASISTLFYPLNMAKSVMQLQIGGKFHGIYETLLQVYHERKGVRGMYRGAGVNVVRSLMSWGIVNSSYEAYKRSLFPSSNHSKSLQ
jgi:hypothetical protein